MAEPVGRASLVACQLTLAAAAARPGETVTALLQVSCSQPEAVELQVGRRWPNWDIVGMRGQSGIPLELNQTRCAPPPHFVAQEVEIEFSGIERIDTSWVQPAYRRATPPINADKRKVPAGWARWGEALVDRKGRG